MEQTRKEGQRLSAPLRPSCHCDPSGAGPDAAPGDRHVTAPEAAQRPEGAARSARRVGDLARRAETGTVRLPIRRASPGPVSPEPVTSARPEETGPGPRGPGRGAARADRARGARIRCGGPRTGHPAAAGRARGAETGRPAGLPEKANPLPYRRDKHNTDILAYSVPAAPCCCSIPHWASMPTGERFGPGC
jgi:hypothetical protein